MYRLPVSAAPLRLIASKLDHPSNEIRGKLLSMCCRYPEDTSYKCRRKSNDVYTKSTFTSYSRIAYRTSHTMFKSCGPRMHGLVPFTNNILTNSSVINKNVWSVEHFQALHQQSNFRAKFSEATDLLSPQGIVNALPNHLQPYLRLMRFDRPIGTWLLYIPCTWSISLAGPAGALPDLCMLTLFGLGSLLMRGAGCTINDMWDKDFDKKVTRTKDRPLASGRISQFQALTFLGLQLSAALMILLSLNLNTIILGVCSMAPVIVYPLMKRITYWPQVFLGLTFNWGAVMGWTAVAGSCAVQTVIPLYAACISWTMVYDTIYAHQDKDDDILIGVKSTALRFGDTTKTWLTGFSALTVVCLGLTGLTCDQTWPYYLGIALFSSHLGRQIMTVDLNNPDDCGKKFRSNRNVGLLLLGSIIFGNLLKEPKSKDSLPNS